MTNNSTGIGARIREALGSETQRAFARRIEMPEDQFSRIVNERQAPQFQNLRRIANGLGVAVEWLACGEGPRRVRTRRVA